MTSQQSKDIVSTFVGHLAAGYPPLQLNGVLGFPDKTLLEEIEECFPDKRHKRIRGILFASLRKLTNKQQSNQSTGTSV